jgi:hypothetical protein
MANALYDTGRNAFLTGDIDWVADDIRAILVDVADYTVDLAAHNFLDDVPSGARVATLGASLANKTAVAGVADADDATFSAVTGDPSEALVLYRHTGTESTSQLVAYIDSATGLPVTPNGGDIDVAWDSGANKIFKL